ncbi:MAG: M20/M25/M40 family metallo-hydrolase [Candidatus Eisenbacteria bacterium]|uniref:M20/M25/M40 family metallo-hydrolase n=1 Tax=Eiseniibacteriota bacterium TaxID=2212470 RepID=A0A956NEW7_UNCEI|nr:M20/M25/M40 family metallo-hydrolase [Candidatus Eisenbacteria bacterium]
MSTELRPKVRLCPSMGRRSSSRLSVAFGFACGALAILACTSVSNARADAAESRVQERIATLASPELGGRAPGSPGLESARKAVLEWMKSAGLEAGGEGGSWEQTFGPKDLPHGATLRTEEAHLPKGASWDDVEFVNLVGVLPGKGGSGAHGGAESVVIGAHLDHLGTNDGGEVFTGADDNASGVVALLEAAEQLADDGPFDRDIVFVIFDGEECGLLGSRYYVAHPVRPVQNVQAMINLDTVGRMKDRGLLALGVGSALEMADAIRGINLGYEFELGLPEKGPFASDQVPFYEAGVPVVHFTTGPNLDYHHPTDTADKVTIPELAEVGQFAAELAGYLADSETRFTFVPPGADKIAASAPAPGSAPRRVSLGTIPDFARESGGVLLSGVVPGSPAEKAGLQKGDVLVEMDGVEVDNLGDFSGVLKSHQPGDEVEVVVLRGEERVRAKVALVERK